LVSITILFFVARSATASRLEGDDVGGDPIVAGHAQIPVTSDLEAGNILAKNLAIPHVPTAPVRTSRELEHVQLIWIKFDSVT
jgi:hypothetical protein